MRRSKQVFDFTVVFGFLILVFDHHSNCGACGSTLEHARQDFNFIVLFALSGIARLTGFTAIQIRLQIRGTDL